MLSALSSLVAQGFPKKAHIDGTNIKVDVLPCAMSSSLEQPLVRVLATESVLSWRCSVAWDGQPSL